MRTDRRSGRRTRAWAALVALGLTTVGVIAPTTAASAAPPSNDAFADATPLTVASGSIASTSVEATGEPGEPSHAGSVEPRSVWFRYEPTADGDLMVDTHGTPFDTVLAVYTGPTVSSLTQVALNDDAGGGTTSEVATPVEAGVTYHIAVDGFLGARGPIQLTWSGPPPIGAITTLEGTGIDNPQGITAGPDGNVWFVSRGNDAIGRVTPAGMITTFTDPGISGPWDITTGDDGNLWFTNRGNDSIGRITPDGVVDTFTDEDVVAPEGIIAASGVVWFASYGNDRIGIIHPDGDIETAESAHIDGPRELVATEVTDDTFTYDQVFWTNEDQDSIGRFRPDDAVGEGFTSLVDPTIDEPYGITAEPDGTLWWVNRGDDTVGRFDGAFAAFSPAGLADPLQIEVGPDGNIWFGTSPNGIGLLSPAGASLGGIITDKPVGGLAVGADGHMWYSPIGGIEVVRVNVGGGRFGYWSDIDGPTSITVSSDGTPWFGSFGNHKVGSVAPPGTTTSVAAGASPWDVVEGPDGRIWFGTGAGEIRAVDRTSGVVTAYPDGRLAETIAMTSGPDGNMWFLDRANRAVGRITMGGVIDVFGVPDLADLHDITSGSDGALWFTSKDDHKIGRITTSGVRSTFTGPNLGGPAGITLGNDGALWFANSAGHSLGRITTSGELSEVPIPGEPPRRVTTGPDGAVWFTQTTVGAQGKFGRLTQLGQLELFAPPGLGRAGAITAGDDGSVWLTDISNDVIHRVQPGPPAACGPRALGPFSDVGPSSLFCVDIWWMADAEIAGGFSDGTYRPTTDVSRQAMAAFLYNAAGRPPIDRPCTEAPFPDVPADHVFCPAITWLASTGITGGFADGNYRPTANVSRQGMVAFLYRFSGSPDGEAVSCVSAPFTDVAVDHLFCGEITWLADTGITGGFADGTYRPGADISRQAMAAFLHGLDDLG